MNKRLRRKKHVGEFREFGFEVACVVDLELDSEDFDRWCSRFVEEAIEGNGLCCGGGGTPVKWSVYVIKHKGSATERHREKLTKWFESNEFVNNFVVSELTDSWYE